MEGPDHATYTLVGLSRAPQGQHARASQHKASSRPHLCSYGIVTLGLLSVSLMSLLIVQWTLCKGSKESTCAHCPSCPDLWLRHGNHCYYFSVEKKDWNSSLQFCLAKGSQLLMFADPKEMSPFYGFFRENFHWIGLRNSSGWKWEDGATLSFSRIFQNSDIQSCGAINEKGLHASSCEALLQWVCKQPRS